MESDIQEVLIIDTTDGDDIVHYNPGELEATNRCNFDELELADSSELDNAATNLCGTLLAEGYHLLDTTEDNIRVYSNPADVVESTDLHSSNELEDPRQTYDEDPTPRAKPKSTVRIARVRDKQLREHGKSYMGIKKCENDRWNYNFPRPAKIIKPRCNCKAGRMGKKLKCGEFTEDVRASIFRDFWAKKDWGEKRTLINALVDRKTPKNLKNRKDSKTSRRGNTLIFYLKVDERKRVCKTMFVNTLAITDWFVLSCVQPNQNQEQDLEQEESGDQEEENIPPTPSTSRISPKARISPAVKAKMEALRSFLMALPHMESHYCRKDKTRQYLEPMFQTKTDVFQLYLKYASEKSTPPATLKTFYEEFDRQNLSIYTPRKDQCDTCVGFEAGVISRETYDQHQEQKKLARSEMEADSNSRNENIFVFTMDVQGVLLSPRLQASACYYKMKLCTHNFTIFNNKTGEVKCYIWHEGQGGVSSNEFATMLTSFIRGLQLKPGSEVILWSDNCMYQNRNVNLSNGLLHLSQELKIIIIQKYLQKGHTQMKCDSIHALIERKLKNKVIYAPAQYIDVIQNARKGPQPYVVEYLNFTFFKDFSGLGPFTSIRPGNKTGDPTVADMKAIMYTPDGELYFKLNFCEDWVLLQRRSRKNSVGVIKQLFKVPPKITPDKYRHLQELKAVIPADFHLFYDNLAH